MNEDTMSEYKRPDTRCEIKKVTKDKGLTTVESKTPSGGTFIAVFVESKFKVEMSKVIRTDSEGKTIVW